MAGSETGGSTGALYSLSEHQKRWVVFGLALNEVLVKGIRRHVGKQVKKEYENVKTQKGIDSQSKSGRLKKWSFDLNYKNINGNVELPKGHDLDYRVTSHVDFAKLYLKWYMAKFNAFDEHCDASAVLNLLGRVPVFCDSVQQAASDVCEARNSWAHPAFGDWDSAKFNKCFDDMVELVKVLGLSRGEHLVNELNDWKEKGTLLCLSSPDPELLQFVKQHLNTLEENVDKMAFKTKQERQAVKKSLQDFSTRIEKLEEGFSSLEYRVTKLEEGETSSMHLETANTGTSSEPETTAGGVETRMLKRKDFTGHSSRVPPKRKKEIQKKETVQLADTSPHVPPQKEKGITEKNESEQPADESVSFKPGTVSEDDFLGLAHELGPLWKKVGLALKVPNAVIDHIDANKSEVFNKCHTVLTSWQERCRKDATYHCLARALNHPAVGRADVADKYCSL